jgi:hypothetical protein
MSSLRAAVLIAGVAMLAVSGCGSSGSSKNSSGTVTTVASQPPGNASTAEVSDAASNGHSPVSQAELTTKGNAICKRVHTRLIRLSKGKGEDLEQIYAKAAGYEQIALNELGKLVPPADLASDWKQILSAMSALAENSTKYSQLAAAKKTREADNLVNVYGPIKHQGVAVAKQDGLEECALAL